MDENVLAILDGLFILLYLAIFARVILTWIIPQGTTTNPFVNFIHLVTEPILAPLRRIIPRVGFFDFSPMVALIIIAVVQTALHTA